MTKLLGALAGLVLVTGTGWKGFALIALALIWTRPDGLLPVGLLLAGGLVAIPSGCISLGAGSDEGGRLQRQC